jgi:hypothetical protein
MHLISRTLSMWPSLFRETDWVADIDWSKNRVFTGATSLYTVFGPVYISINRNFKTPSMILIKSTLKIFICLYVRFYLFLKLEFLLRFLDSLKIIFCVFNSIKTIVTDIEGNIRIYRLPSGRGTNHEIDISLASGSGKIIFTGPYHDPWAVCISRYCPPYQ